MKYAMDIMEESWSALSPYEEAETNLQCRL